MSHVGESRRKSTVIYRSPDDINNFKIRVILKEIKGNSPRNADEKLEKSEIQIFSWQQKIHGKFEREFYKDSKNCVTDLDKKYHEDVANLIQDEHLLFTYVDEDEFCLNEESCVSNSKITTQLCKQMNNMQLTNDKDVFSENADGFNFKEQLINSLNYPYGNYNNFETMYIMADLGEYVGDTWLKSEYILCMIKYDHARNLLVLYPDFNDLAPYYIQNDRLGSRDIQYYIQDASKKMPPDSVIKENLILNKISSHQAKVKLQKTGVDFELPTKNKLSVHLFLEILTARNFEYNDIYVQYFIDLPENWSCKDGSFLTGATQTSHTYGEDNLAHFGFPVEISLECNVEDLNESGIFRAPYIYFEVISKSSWDRFRTEGLTYTIVPISQPGVYRYNLHCLRICAKGPIGNLRRFFIGDCSSYNDVTWTSVPKNHDKKMVNKYGIDTVGTGQISIRMNVVHQSQAFMADFIMDGSSRKHEKFILEKLSMSTLVKSIEQVLEAFKLAKSKMIQARKNV